PQPGSAVAVYLDCRFLCVVPWFSIGLELAGAGDARVAGLPARDIRSFNSPTRYPLDQSLLEYLGRLSHQHRAVCSDTCLATPPGIPDGRCDRSHAVSPVHFSEEIAPVGLSG